MNLSFSIKPCMISMLSGDLMLFSRLIVTIIDQFISEFIFVYFGKKKRYFSIFEFFSTVIYFNSQMEDYKFLFKVVLIGNSGVGKTCLVRRFTQGVFPKGQGATIGVDFMIKTLEIENSAGQREAVKLQIWDTGKACLISCETSILTPFYLNSRSGTIPVYHPVILPKRPCSDSRLRHLVSANFRRFDRLDTRNSRIC